MQAVVTPPRLVVLISGRGSNLARLIEAIEQGRLAAEIVAVVCNRPEAGGVALARQAGIAVELIDHTRFADRTGFDQALARAIAQYRPDWIVLAGFMRVLTGDFVNAHLGRMINLHPSLLPLFPGLHTHQQVLEAGHRQHGSSVHFVTEQLDGGPVLAQARIPIQPADTPDTLKQRLSPIEHQLLEASVRLLCTHQVRLVDGQIELDGTLLDSPLNLIDGNHNFGVLV